MKSLINRFGYIAVSLTLGLALFVIVGAALATNNDPFDIGPSGGTTWIACQSGAVCPIIGSRGGAGTVTRGGMDNDATTQVAGGSTTIILRARKAYSSSFNFGLILAAASTLLLFGLYMMSRREITRTE